jgi:putative membrane protein
MKTTRLFAALSMAFAVAQCVSAQTSVPVGVAKADADRLVAIAQANIAEVAAGKIAIEKSGNADVKAFAQQMIDDHGKGLDDTRKVAAAKNVTLPSEPDAAHKKVAADLRKLSGAAFDKEYVSKAGVADHAAVHAALKNDIANARDADVKALATRLEPVVAHHGEMAQKLNATVK